MAGAGRGGRRGRPRIRLIEVWVTTAGPRGRQRPASWAWSDSDGKSRQGGIAEAESRQGGASSALAGLAAVLDTLRRHDFKRETRLIVHSESAYLVKASHEWIRGWRDNGWRTYNDGRPVRHRGLIEAIDRATKAHHGHVSYRLDPEEDPSDGMLRAQSLADGRLKRYLHDRRARTVMPEEALTDLRLAAKGGGPRRRPSPDGPPSGRSPSRASPGNRGGQRGGSRVDVWTDGSALSPQGPMGWAWHDGGGHEDSGGAVRGTNNIGELTAVLMALRRHGGEAPLAIHSDSQYAINCSSTWVDGWRRRGWRSSSGTPVMNLPLVKAIAKAIADRPGPVDFIWLHGHRGDPGNERCDFLAGRYARGIARGDKGERIPEEASECLRGGGRG